MRPGDGGTENAVFQIESGGAIVAATQHRL
jgi:hypothetical protein